MATKSISQLDTQATANETDLFEVAIVDANSASGYASKKESAAAIADAIVGEYQYPLRITGTTAKTIAGAINELKNLVDLLPQFAIEVVQTLPVSDISETTIYLVPASDPEQGNYYEEYIYVNNAWELVGTTAVDLSGYYTSAQVDTLLAAKADSSSLATVATSGAYSDLTGKPTIDTALDTTSTNAVENRAVAGEINSIKSDITVEGSASGDIATFVDGSANPLKELKISIVATQSGSGDPSPTNVRPITGWTGCNIPVKGFNLWDEDWEQGSISSSNGQNENDNTRIRTVGYIPVKPNTQYYFKTEKTLGLRFYDANKTYLSYITTVSGVNTTPQNCYYLRFIVLNETTYNNNISVNYPSTETTYHAYNSNSETINIDWQSTAGTIYGGKSNVKAGGLQSDYYNVLLSQFEFTKIAFSTKNGYYMSRFDLPFAPVPPTSTKTQDAISSMFVGTYQNASSWPENSFVFTVNAGVLPANSIGFIVPKTIDTVEKFLETYGNAQLVYKLATPVTYQLTPTEIRSLLGTNNIWADCGAITELKYTRDLNLCINDIIARIEALEGASNTRSLSLSPVLTKSLTSDSDTAEGKTEEETEEETKEEAQKNER